MSPTTKPLLAIPSWELSGRVPRGIERVARAFAEQLVAMDIFETVCITEMIKESRRPLFLCEPLPAWLRSRDIEMARGAYFAELKNRIWHALPPTVAPVASNLYRLMLLAIDTLRGAPPRRQLLRGRAKLRLQIPEGSDVIALDDLDYLVLFEPADILYDSDLTSDHCTVVSFVHDAIPLRVDEGEYWNPQEFAGFIRRLGLYSRIVLCDSESTYSDVRTFFGEEFTRKCEVNLLGHDRDRFTAPGDEQRDASVLKELGLGNGRPYFVFIGTVEDRKNIKNILRAAQIVARRAPQTPIDLCLIGFPQSVGRYEALVKEVRRHVGVVLPGYLPGKVVPSVLRNSVALMFPSLWEGFGLPILEAMSARTRVITSDLSSMPEVGGEHAIYCDPYDPSSIADAMMHAMAEPAEERRRAVDAAFEYAGQFTWTRAAERMVSVLGVRNSAKG